MSLLACKLVGMLPLGSRSSWAARVRSGGQPAGGGWPCLELTERTAEQPLRTVRELVVRRPAALSLKVLAAAPDLLAVVVPEHSRLPAPIAAELARREIAVVWRELPTAAVPSSEAVRPSAAVPSSGPRGTCTMSRPGRA
jgi:hypothetical protein